MKTRRLLPLALLALLVPVVCATSSARAQSAADTSQVPVPGQISPGEVPAPTPAPVPPTSPARPALIPGSIWLGVNGGIGLPFGDFAHKATSGFNLGLTGDYLVYENLAVGGELSWHSFGGNDNLEKDLSAKLRTSADLKISVVPATVHAKYFLPAGQTVTPFVKGALGLYNYKERTEYGTNNTEHSSTRIGFQVGGGANFKSVTSMLYGFDFMYLYIATEDKATNMLVVRGQLMFGWSRR